MAFSINAINQIIKALTYLNDKGTTSKRVLSYGYPDLIAPPGSLDLPLHPDSGLPESYAFFRRFGWELTVVDYKELRLESKFGEFWAADLNAGVFDSGQSYGMTLDPGTLEHIFLPHLMLQSIVKHLEVGGFAYHSNPINAINHGFFNFSPTYLIDFYLANGFSLSMPLLEKFGSNEPAKPLEKPLARFNDLEGEHIMLLAGIKTKEMEELVWPLQSKYKEMLG